MKFAQFMKGSVNKVIFHGRDLLLNNIPWLNRPVQIDTNQIKTLE